MTDMSDVYRRVEYLAASTVSLLMALLCSTAGYLAVTRGRSVMGVEAVEYALLGAMSSTMAFALYVAYHAGEVDDG